LNPWETLERGQGFFVPALDLAAARQRYLLLAAKAKIFDADCEYGIMDGRLGVYFYRRPRVLPKRTRS